MSKTAKLEIEKWDIKRLIPYAKNAKIHSEEQVKRLAATIKRFDWDQPIVVDRNGVIIKGHGRRLAAIELGLDVVPVLVRRDLTDAEADAIRIADNAVVSMQFDTRLMHEEIQRIMAEDDVNFSIDELGLSDKDKAFMLEGTDNTDLDALMEDTHAEIEKHKSDDADQVKLVDASEIPLAEAFGFKRVTGAQGRVISAFVAEAEASTGKKGRDALVGHMAALCGI